MLVTTTDSISTKKGTKNYYRFSIAGTGLIHDYVMVKCRNRSFVDFLK
ncbi:MAG: hypothetical protein IPP43_15040 [Chitinophagaceae bacterium]|nr:hypothetical protein [Chitinophagaceae bacterium]